MIKDFDALDSAPEARPEAPARALQNGKGIHQVITIHPASPHGQPLLLDHDEKEAKMTTLTVPVQTENPKTLSPFAMRFITLAAAVLMIALLGGVLIEMANGHPKTGYPGAASVLTESPACDANTDYMAQGANSIASGDYAAALTAYNCAITIGADNNAAYLLRGALAGAAGDYDQFGLDLYTFNSHNPADVNNLLNVPVADILPTLASAIEARPDDAPLYLLRGIVLDRTTLSGKSDLVRFKELSPDNAIGYLFSWRAFNDLSDENLQKAIQIAPNSVLLDLILWGNLTEENAAQMRPYLDQAIQANPQHPFA
jgi:tetratricopeptide (TPR) repeat protein